MESIINNERKLHSVDELLELPPGTLTGSEQLGQLAAWDSVAVISFLAMADERFNVSIQAQDIAKCKTVADLIALLP